MTFQSKRDSPRPRDLVHHHDRLDDTLRRMRQPRRADREPRTHRLLGGDRTGARRDHSAAQQVDEDRVGDPSADLIEGARARQDLDDAQGQVRAQQSRVLIESRLIQSHLRLVGVPIGGIRCRCGRGLGGRSRRDGSGVRTVRPRARAVIDGMRRERPARRVREGIVQIAPPALPRGGGRVRRGRPSAWGESFDRRRSRRHGSPCAVLGVVRRLPSSARRGSAETCRARSVAPYRRRCALECSCSRFPLISDTAPRPRFARPHSSSGGRGSPGCQRACG
ncbi:hypothetical protein N136_03826 [Leifsonia aquatica ATCC 14665]|uniref:Uncharacterized protein n=1 Tax=Leifsonia aquatica ATCC 14665 TaxID=1358026 RepID=U2R3K4_LEIAQ|nr:hypothetical protein N136_03826 [Leifsonia aquatica ATCC 14665]